MNSKPTSATNQIDHSPVAYKLMFDGKEYGGWADGAPDDDLMSMIQAMSDHWAVLFAYSEPPSVDASELPPLPQYDHVAGGWAGSKTYCVYTADQMRTYAIAAIAGRQG